MYTRYGIEAILTKLTPCGWKWYIQHWRNICHQSGHDDEQTVKESVIWDAMTYKWHCNARIDQLVTGKMIIVENNTMNYFVSFITSKFCWLHTTVERIWTRHAGVCCCCLQGVISTWTFALKEWTGSPLFASCRCCPAVIEWGVLTSMIYTGL